MSAETLLFWVFSACVLGSAGAVILARNPIQCAMALVATFFFLAGVYVLLWAHTIAVLQVLVYAGAIMVLFLFVIMLLSLPEPGPLVRPKPSRILGGAATVGILAVLAAALAKLPAVEPTGGGDPATFGTLRVVGELLYTRYLLPFEAVSLLLLTAIVGAVVVAKSRI